MSDSMDHPAHYQGWSVEPIEIIKRMSFPAGSAVKYMMRLGKKGPRLEDLQKTARYLRLILDEGLSTGVTAITQGMLHQVALEAREVNVGEFLHYMADGRIVWCLEEVDALIKGEEARHAEE